MSTLFMEVFPQDLIASIEYFTKKTGVECRAAGAAKAEYLDEHIVSSKHTPPVGIGVQWDQLLRVMCRWAIMYNPWCDDIDVIFDIIKEKLSKPGIELCSAQAVESVMKLYYPPSKRKTSGSTYVIFEDLRRHVQSTWEVIYVPLFMEIKNPSDKWLAMFVYPTAHLAATLPVLFEEEHNNIIRTLESQLSVTKEQWLNQIQSDLGEGLIATLVNAVAGRDIKAGIKTFVCTGSKWRVVGILLSFYFKLYPTVINTNNTVLLCYFLTYEFLYSSGKDWKFPSDLRHRISNLFECYEDHYEEFIIAEHQCLVKNESIILEFGKYLGIYAPPAVAKEKVNVKTKGRRGLQDTEEDVVLKVASRNEDFVLTQSHAPQSSFNNTNASSAGNSVKAVKDLAGEDSDETDDDQPAEEPVIKKRSVAEVENVDDAHQQKSKKRKPSNQMRERGERALPATKRGRHPEREPSESGGEDQISFIYLPTQNAAVAASSKDSSYSRKHVPDTQTRERDEPALSAPKKGRPPERESSENVQSSSEFLIKFAAPQNTRGK